MQLGLEDSLAVIQKDASVKAVVVKGAGKRAFCAGADIQDLNRKHERNPKIPFMEVFEGLDVPVVAALQGFTLGGGFELSLGCHYRVIASNGVVGLPEVDIGLLPGGQGTQRLPRLIGVDAGLELLLSGKHVPAKQALEWKVVDKIVPPEELLAAAKELALSKASEPMAPRRISNMPAPKTDEAVFDKFTKQMKAKRKGQPAAMAIIDCVKAACNEKSFQAGCAEEQRLFRQVLASPEAQALQHMFFSERAAGKLQGVKAKPAKVKAVGIIGAGTMGGGIAMCFAQIGCQVILVDREQKFLDRGLKTIQGNYARSVKRGSRSQTQVDEIMKRIHTSVDYAALKDVDLVIEAVFEDLALKKEIFQKLDAVCKPDCILASNTSFLDIDAMAMATKRPQKVMGMHFFSPANVMPLLENIRGAQTDDQTLATCQAIGGKIGKWPVLVENRYGFVGNRMIQYYSLEARTMLNEGALPAQVDAVAIEFGMPMGPFMMADLTGLDIGFQAKKKRGEVNVDKNVQDALIEAGRLGMKNGKGYYDYVDGRKRVKSDLVIEMVKKVAQNNGLPQRQLSDQEVLERLFYPLINEGFKILEEGVAKKPSDIDVVYAHGYNWPRVTGGPMNYADRIGLDKILGTLQKYEQQYPSQGYFKPAKLLLDCVEAKQSLAAFWQKNGSNYKFASSKAKL